MGTPFLKIVLILALGAVGAWYGYHALGPVGVVGIGFVAAFLLSRPIIDFLDELRYEGKAAMLAPVQGRLWAHRGARIDIAQDVDGERWLLAADVRKVVPGLPRDEVLQRQFGERAGPVEDHEGFRIRADALAEYLRKSTDTPSLKFRNWLDKDVLGGSRNPRAR